MVFTVYCRADSAGAIVHMLALPRRWVDYVVLTIRACCYSIVSQSQKEGGGEQNDVQNHGDQ